MNSLGLSKQLEAIFANGVLPLPGAMLCTLLSAANSEVFAAPVCQCIDPIQVHKTSLQAHAQAWAVMPS